MDHKGCGKKNKKRTPSDEDANSDPKKIHLTSSPGSQAGPVAEAERYFVELLPRMKPLLSQLVQVEVKSAFQTHFHSLIESLSRGRKEMGEEVIIEPETEKFKLVFCDEIASTIFTNNEIRAENGKPLRVAICDANANAIICTGVLSSTQIELYVLDGEHGSGQQEKETHLTLSNFSKSILSPRDGKRPLLVGNDQKLNLENGVGLIKNLCITDNSSWMKSKKFRLGAKIKDENILANFSRIEVAVSPPFRVMDHRGEVNKKHHPPSKDDEVWRLEGIGKDGAYHKNLSSHHIKTVGGFLNAYREMGADSLRKLLGNKVPKKTWMMMVENAFECVNVIPTYQQNSKATSLGNKVMAADEAFNKNIEVYEQMNLGYGSEISPGTCLDELGYVVGYVDSQPWYGGEICSTSYDVGTQALTTPNTIEDMTKLAP